MGCRDHAGPVSCKRVLFPFNFPFKTFESKISLYFPTIETFAAPSTVNVSPDAQSTPNKAHISPAFTSLTSCNNEPSYPSLYTLLNYMKINSMRKNTVFMMFIVCLRLRAQGVVSERFHSELFQKDPGLLT